MIKKRPRVFNFAPIQPKEIASKAAFPWFRVWKDKLQDWLACSCPWPRAHSLALQIRSGAHTGDAALQMSLYTLTRFRPSNHPCWRAKHLINGSSGFSSGMHSITDGNVWAGGHTCWLYHSAAVINLPIWLISCRRLLGTTFFKCSAQAFCVAHNIHLAIHDEQPPPPH